MPISNCGPPIFTSGPEGHTVPVNRRQLLAMRGPTIAVDVGFDPGFHGDESLLRATIDGIGTKPPTSVVPALIDTGASECCIDEDLAVKLKLPLIDRQKGSGIGGTEEFNMYLGYIRIPELALFHYGKFMGVRLNAGGQPHLVLLGRSALVDTILIYNGTTGGVQLAT